jgi:hypothetical protein
VVRKLINPTGLQAIRLLSMGKVIIAPGLKRQRVQIDVDGNEVRPFTKQVVAPVEQEYAPTPDELKAAATKQSVEVINSPTNPLADMIKAQVNKAVQESIKGIDIGKMVEEAVKEAFK